MPLGPAGCVVELSINRHQLGDLPEVRPGDPLPEVGPFLELPVGDDLATMYRYVLTPRGLRALYASKRMLGVYCVYCEAEGNRFLFRFKADQQAARETAVWLKAQVDQLELAYQQSDRAALLLSPLLEAVRNLMVEDVPLEAAHLLYLSEAAAEVEGEVVFLHRSTSPDPGPYRLKLPAAPGTRPGLALRLEGVERRVTRRGVTETTGRGNRGVRVELTVPGVDRETRHVARTDAEGWAQFPVLELVSARRLRLRVGPAKKPPTVHGQVVLRWGRPLEQALDRPVPVYEPASSTPVTAWRKLLLGDLVASWDPDRGVLRCSTPGQVLFDGLDAYLDLEVLGSKEAWVKELLAAMRTRIIARGSGHDPMVRYALDGLGPTGARKAARDLQARLDQEPVRVWTGAAAMAVRRLLRIERRRPDRVLAKVARSVAESLAYRVEAELEPTWRYRAHGRPVKTFKANPDVAQPHAEGILALAQAASVPGLEWLLEVAERQAEHLVESHPVDGQPPGWVLGTWKDQARLETPVRIGQALDALQALVPSARLARRAERVRALVWNRFLTYRNTVEIGERLRLAAWLQTVPDLGPGARTR